MSVASYDGAPTGTRPSGVARSSSVAPVLRVEHLSMRFGGLVAVNDFSFAARRGDITALIGPNGAGKSTFFKLLAGEIEPTEGEVVFRGRRITGLGVARGAPAEPHAAAVDEQPRQLRGLAR